MSTSTLHLYLDDPLQDLLPRTYKGNTEITYPLTRRASIKDIIESLRIPHTEVESIFRGDCEISFQHIPQAGEQFVLHGVSSSTDVTQPTFLRPNPLQQAVFMVDINAGKLARLLRMAGIDTWYIRGLTDTELAEQAVISNRVLLSRNRDLLQRKIITWGHLVRAQQPKEQLIEILTLYNLTKAIKAFSRCLECNTLLDPVEKSTILHRLEPLTIKYYKRFHICPDCERIYWRGSHHGRMERLINTILALRKDGNSKME